MTTLLERIAALTDTDSVSDDITLVICADGKEMVRQYRPANITGNEITCFDRFQSVSAAATITAITMWNQLYSTGKSTAIDNITVELTTKGSTSSCSMSWCDTVKYQQVVYVASKMLTFDISLDAVSASIESVCCAADIDPELLNAAIQIYSGIALNES